MPPPQAEPPPAPGSRPTPPEHTVLASQLSNISKCLTAASGRCFRPQGDDAPYHCILSFSMPRRSLRPELNRIRAWVRQGRTDAWIAHQLEGTVQQIQAFKREQGLAPDADPDAGAAGDFDDEIDLRAEDDALI